MPKSPSRRERNQNRIFKKDGLMSVAFGPNVVTSNEKTGEHVMTSRGFNAQEHSIADAHEFNVDRVKAREEEEARKDQEFSEKFDIQDPKG